MKTKRGKVIETADKRTIIGYKNILDETAFTDASKSIFPFAKYEINNKIPAAPKVINTAKIGREINLVNETNP